MKSKYFAVALLAVALVACNNEDVLEVNQGRGISFQVATEASTRATGVATTTTTIDNFKVWGFTDGKTLMDGLNVTKSGSEWTYGGTIFWPTTAVDFYSVSPSDVAGVSINKDEKKISYTVNEQIDLLYAVNKGETKAAHEDKAVSINFRHALSQIVFKAKNTNENLKVTIKGVKIANIKKAGDFTYPTQATTDQYEYDPENDDATIVATTQGEWDDESLNTLTTFSAGMDDTGVTLTGKVETAVNLSNATGALFMIPQSLTPWNPSTTGALNQTNTGVYFLVNCQILSGTNKDVTVWPTTEADEDSDGYAEVAIPASKLTWEQGKKYVYTFVFGEGGGYEPGTDPNPEQTLFGIDFQVTVDDFIPVTPDEEIDMDTEDAGE